jgi:hypothetical protein
MRATELSGGLLGPPAATLGFTGARPRWKSLVDRRRLGAHLLVRHSGQLLEVSPGFMRSVEGNFATPAGDQIPDVWNPLPVRLGFFNVPQFHIRECAQLPAQWQGWTSWCGISWCGTWIFRRCR